MTRDEYISIHKKYLLRKAELNFLQSELDSSIKQVKQAYVDSVSDLKAGDKVEVKYKYVEKLKSIYRPANILDAVGVFYIRRVWADDAGRIYYSFWKSKKDGSVSEHRMLFMDEIKSEDITKL
jgi:hypothetical protein